MKEKRAGTWTPRLGLKVPDVLLPDIRGHPTIKTRWMSAIPPSAILSRKGIVRYGGGISHWAAKLWLWWLILNRHETSQNVIWEETKGQFCKAVLANVPPVPVCGVHIQNHIACFYQGSTAGKELFGGNFGTGEHLPKPPFWKPPFCARRHKKSKKSLWGSLRGVPADPPKESNESLESKNR